MQLLVGTPVLLMLKQVMQLLLLNKLVYRKELTLHVTMKQMLQVMLVLTQVL